MTRSAETLILAGAFLLLSQACAALQSVTPADRAQAYVAEAKAAGAACKAYAFDRSAGLVPEVPAMSKLCE